MDPFSQGFIKGEQLYLYPDFFVPLAYLILGQPLYLKDSYILDNFQSSNVGKLSGDKLP